MTEEEAAIDIPQPTANFDGYDFVLHTGGTTTTMARIERSATGAVGPGQWRSLPREVTATAATEIATVAGGASTDTRRRETGDTTEVATEAATEVGGSVLDIFLYIS